MTETTGTLQAAARFIARHRGLLLPVGAAMMIFVVLVPLSPGVMDVLLAANIALSAIILLTAIGVASPLEFSVFPSVLLGATLFRLVLNVASTRLILTAGADGAGPVAARLAAGQVIWSFSQFVTSGSLAVGIILFAIIAIIQFVVITKGAGRISEVAARFVLDAIPGKQMAIDADLSAGVISSSESHERRRQISREADFYGAMDGASKFVRGDAITAVIITMVNILGGLFIGLMQRGWSLNQTLALFTRLTIGDGLVTQIPALLVSVAAALIVSRSMDKTNFGEQVISQLTAKPVALAITAGFLCALMLTSLPKAPLLVMGIGCAGLAVILSGRRRGHGAEATADVQDEPGTKDDEEIRDLLAVEAMRIDIGFALVELVDQSREGDLLSGISTLRREMAGELGLVVPPIRIADDMRIGAHEYVIKIRGAKVAAGKLYPDQLLAIAGSGTKGKLVGREATECAFAAPALWINPDQADHAQAMGYTVVSPPRAMTAHLAETIRAHGSLLLSRQQVARMLENLKDRAAALVQEVTDKAGLAKIQKVLQKLLAERVSIRDLETILETLSDHAESNEDIEAITERVREALAPALCQQYCGRDGKLWCISLDAELEDAIGGHVAQGGTGLAVTGAEEVSQPVSGAVSAALDSLVAGGHSPVVVCRPGIRRALRGLIGKERPAVAVLGYNEVNGVEVQTVARVGIEQ